MESNNWLKEVDIKNCTYYHSDDIMKVGDFDFDKVLLDKKIIWKYFDFWHFIQNFYGWKTIVY